MRMFTDSHAHIYAREFDEDRQRMIDRASQQGIGKIYMPNVDSASIDRMMETEEKNPGVCVAMMGLHPCSVKKDFEKELYLVEDWLGKRNFAAVGEIGIDLYWDTSLLSEQEEAFKVQIELAKTYSLPIVIHCRNSFRETIDLLMKNMNDTLKGVFHCFSGNLKEAREVMDIGFYLGIGGVATFKNSGLDKVLPDIDLNYILLETDAPYLAPVPHRGKRNEPSFIPIIAEKIASCKNISPDEVAEVTTANSRNLFRM
jgi:TatD DNase family protein